MRKKNIYYNIDINNRDYIYIGLHNVSDDGSVINSIHPYILEKILSKSVFLGYSLNLFDDNPKKIILTFDDGRKFSNTLTDILDKFNATCIFFLCFDRYIKSYPKDKRYSEVTKDNIEYLKKRHLVGIHTNDHTKLKGKPYEDQYNIIYYNIKKFKDVFNFSPTLFSYPWGKYDKNTIDILNTFKIKYSFIASPGTLKLNRHKIPRMFIDDKDYTDIKNIIKVNAKVINNIKLIIKTFVLDIF